MRVTIVGSGKVAEALASAIGKGLPGIEPGEIWSRSSRGREIASRTGLSPAGSPGTLAPADLYIIAVSDGAIGEVSRQLKVPSGSVVAHTSGATDIEAIRTDGAMKAVFYPLQTFSEEREADFSRVPVFLEYTTPAAGETLGRFAHAVSGSVHQADSRLRARLHLAAVFACNFTNLMYTIGQRIAADEGLTFEVLKPLIAETAAKAVASDDPAAVQTGPAVRGDDKTIELHMKLLRGCGERRYEDIYRLLTETIWEISKKI